MCAYRWEKNPINQQEPELIIDGWESGIGAAPEQGVNIKNCNIESVPGTVRPNWKLDQQTPPNNTSFVFTVDTIADLIVLSGGLATTIPMNLQAVQFTTTGTLPAGLSVATTYWLAGSITTGKYSVAISLANAISATFVNITDNGTGVHTVTTFYNLNTITFFANVPISNNNQDAFVQFALDSKGQLWYFYAGISWILILGNTSTTDQNGATGHGVGNGLQWFQSSGNGGTITSYLFVIGNGTVDVLNVTALVANPAAPVWNTTWMTLETGLGFLGSHYAHLAQDNIVYICDAQFLDRIRETPTQNFDPTNNATYFQEKKVITLPTYSSAQCLEELSLSLYIGDLNTNRIYTVDLTNTSGLFVVSQILRVAEKNIWRMKNIDNSLYVLAGTKGHIYQTTGYAFTREMKIPEYISGGQISAWGGMEAVSGALLFGLTPTLVAGSGVYKLYTNVGQFAGSVVGSLICDETPLDSTGLATNATALLTDNIPDEFYFIGCAGAIYRVDSTTKLANYEAYVESDLIPVGTVLQNRTFQNIEYKLDFAPTSGGVRLSWRPDLNASYTLIKDFNCAGLIGDIQTPANITNTQFLQIKAELKGGTGFNTPRLRELRLR